MIAYLKNKDINKQKWDDCIENAVNKRIYAFSWYLDIVCPGWDALVMGEYEYVMPLSWKKKYGIRYVYQPFLTQHFGVFSDHELTCEIMNSFIDNLSGKFKFIEININKEIGLNSNNMTIKPMINYELNLNKPHSEIYKGYNKGTKHNINKAIKMGCVIKDIADKDTFIPFITSYSKISFRARWLDTLKSFFNYVIENGHGKAYGVYVGNELSAVSLILETKLRSIFLMSASSQKGKDSGAISLLLDTYFKQYSDNEKVFDFEGSNIEGIAYFFKSFGAERKEYYRLKINKLPAILKLLKK